MAEIRRAFESRQAIDDFQAVKATDLEISKNGNQIVIAFAYRKEVPLFANVGVYIDFAANSANECDARYAALETRLGYRFAAPALLEQALTHRSHGAEHNERLEFLGDGVLGCAVADELYGRFPGLPEGKLTRLRAGLVREEALAEVGERLGLRGAAARRAGHAGDSRRSSPTRWKRCSAPCSSTRGYDAARAAVLAAFGPLLDGLDAAGPAKDAEDRAAGSSAGAAAAAARIPRRRP